MTRMDGKDGTKRRDKPRERPLPMPIPIGSARNRDWSKDPRIKAAQRTGAPTYGPLTRAHLETTKEDIENRIRSLAQKLRVKPYRNWTATEMADAQEYLGPKLVAAIIAHQNRRK